jgi:1-aminocyclopropane-1-carboxylate deaminase/D-cysteine desulfhydrase-like pyridoxal-dependent ACC family enzyme
LIWNLIIREKMLMIEPYISVAAGLIGALIGASASIITIVVQAKIQDKRQQLQTIIQLALEDYKLQMEICKNSGKRVCFYPIILHLHYYQELMKLMEESKLGEENIKDLFEKNKKLRQLIDKLNESRSNE